jgi:hypothetical protein
MIWLKSSCRCVSLLPTCATMAHAVCKTRTQYGGEGSSSIYLEQTHFLQTVSEGVGVYCEVGFNVGNSALTVMKAEPNAVVHSFDLGKQFSREAFKFLSGHYAQLRLHWGDSTVSIPSVTPLGCDVIFVDGGHTVSIEYRFSVRYMIHDPPLSSIRSVPTPYHELPTCCALCMHNLETHPA